MQVVVREARLLSGAWGRESWWLSLRVSRAVARDQAQANNVAGSVTAGPAANCALQRAEAKTKARPGGERVCGGCPRFRYTGDGTHSRHGVIFGLARQPPARGSELHARTRHTSVGPGPRGDLGRPRAARHPGPWPWSVPGRVCTGGYTNRPWDVEYTHIHLITYETDTSYRLPPAAAGGGHRARAA